MSNNEKIRPLDLNKDTATNTAVSETVPIAKEKKKVNWKLALIGVGIIVLGIASGFGLSAVGGGSGGGSITDDLAVESIDGRKVKKGEVYGSDSEQFSDSAIGVIEVNEDEDIEGTHRLLREGGESQTAYLTSSVVDLNLFVGHEVEVWGETFAAQKASWLLDVGRVKVIK